MILARFARFLGPARIPPPSPDLAADRLAEVLKLRLFVRVKGSAERFDVDLARADFHRLYDDAAMLLADLKRLIEPEVRRLHDRRG